MESKDLIILLRSGKNEFADQTIHISGNVLTINENHLMHISSLSFHNCTFTGTHLEFEDINNSDFYLGFFDCSFEISLDIKNCIFKRLGFRDVKCNKSINISGGIYSNFFFRNNNLESKKENKLEGNVSISNLTIKEKVELDFINHTKGKFEFSDNIIYKSDLSKEDEYTTFENSTFENAEFYRNEFFNEANFKEIEIKNDGKFEECKFKKVNFNESKFSIIEYVKCDFLSTTWFEYCRNIQSTRLKFVACEFKGFVLYNHSTLHFLNINRCTFDKSVSFTDAEFNSIKLFEVKFGGGAYFDEMKINDVLDKSYLTDKNKILEWKRTLRAIKQELQKTENKIDFNTYRNYELTAHYKELKLLKNFKDTTILWATKWSSNFGNWFWALCFTIISGLLWYSFLYRVENSGILDFAKINDFFVGAFRFFLVTDFHNPLIEDSKAYLESGWSWLIFILGKIFIAFGIYEMIQSFRKFKA